MPATTAAERLSSFASRKVNRLVRSIREVTFVCTWSKTPGKLWKVGETAEGGARENPAFPPFLRLAAASIRRCCTCVPGVFDQMPRRRSTTERRLTTTPGSYTMSTYTPQQRVLLLELSERTSAKGNPYMSGWLGKASVVAFRAEHADKHGNPVWQVFVTEPQQEQQRAQITQHLGGAPTAANRSASPDPRPLSANEVVPDRPPSAGAVAGRQRGGWKGSEYRRQPGGHQNGPTGQHGAFYDEAPADMLRAG